MEKRKTIYDICYHILAIFCNIIDNFDSGDIEDLTNKLINFLNYDSNYDNLFEYIDENIKLEKNECKQILKLIMVSCVYKNCLYELKQGINTEYNEEMIIDIEKMDCNQIIELFDEYSEESLVIDYFDIFLSYISKNYLFYEACNYEIIKQNKLSELIKINPYELGNFMFNYKDISNMSYDEKYIQIYFNIYKKSFTQVYIDKDEDFDEEFLSYFKKNVYNYFNNEEVRVLDFLGYVFGNIYENIVVLTDNTEEAKAINKELSILYANGNLEKMKNSYFNNIDFFEKMNTLFFSFNNELEKEELEAKKSKFNEIGDIQVIKKYDRHYNGVSKQKKLKHPD